MACSSIDGLMLLINLDSSMIWLDTWWNPHVLKTENFILQGFYFEKNAHKGGNLFVLSVYSWRILEAFVVIWKDMLNVNHQVVLASCPRRESR